MITSSKLHPCLIAREAFHSVPGCRILLQNTLCHKIMACSVSSYYQDIARSACHPAWSIGVFASIDPAYVAIIALILVLVRQFVHQNVDLSRKLQGPADFP
jgi:hypothetical protein